MFEIEFGKSPEELFLEFDYEPIAAASLAQVFRAKTKDGRHVAVKVQYIDLIKRFSGDFATILFLQDIIKIIHKNYNFGWILRDLRKNLEQVRFIYLFKFNGNEMMILFETLQELDFIHEAKNSERCAKELKKFNFVHVPDVEWNLTSKVNAYILYDYFIHQIQ